MNRFLSALLIPLALFLAAGSASATNCPAYPFTLTNGTPADANRVMGDFNSILTCANTTLLSSTGVTSIFTGAQLLANPGYQVFPGGWTEEAGSLSVTGGTGPTVTLPHTMGTAILSISLTGSGNAIIWAADTLTTSSFRIVPGSYSGSATVYWHVTGY